MIAINRTDTDDEHIRPNADDDEHGQGRIQKG